MLRDDLMLIQTVDFFPPIVDDPYRYGQIAAANSLSDIYAMGASPNLALNILCIPSCLSPEEVSQIMAGGAQKVQEAGAIIAGGHSVEDNEPKYGLCVTACIDPKYIWSNAGAKPGDVIILTKPLGNGILATAAKQDKITQAEFEEATESMATLNKYARDAAVDLNVHACTDITGFGFMGHAGEMAKASGVTLEIDSKNIPVFKHALELAEQGIIPGGVLRNEAYLTKNVLFHKNVSRSMQSVLFDPQTSGGLLFAISEDALHAFVCEMNVKNIPFSVIGKAIKPTDYYIQVH